MRRDLGKMGESLLRGWSAEAGLIVNSSDDHDAAGWDFLLEWPAENHPNLAASFPLDRRPAPLQCLVQVKSTTSKRRRWSVKLSNWWRFVRHPAPTFFLVLEYDTSGGCQRGFLIHVGASYIERVLKRLRELTVRNSDVKLHEHTMDFTWGDDDQISALNGPALAAAVQRYTPLGLEEYVTHKQRFLAKVGYEEVGQKLRVKPRFPDDWQGTPDELLVDFALGLVPHLEIETGEIVDWRFGIPAVLPRALPESELHILDRRPVGRGTIRLRAAPSTQELLLDADVYVPHGVEVNGEHFKVRYSTPFLDIAFHLTGSQKLEWKSRFPSIRTAHRLADFQPVANLILLLHEATVAGSAEIEFHFTFESRPVRSGRLVVSRPLPRPLVEWAGRAKHAWIIARFFEIEREVITSAAELARYRRQLHLLTVILQSTPAYFRVDFSLDEAQVDLTLPWCVPLAATARLGRFQVQASFMVLGHAEPTGEILNGKRMYLFQSTEVRPVQKKLYRDPEMPEMSDRDLVTELSDKHQEEMQVLLTRTLPWLKE
ncbi:MAG TPA: hypothetical protein VHG93_10720 [Longimicrobium sp.]|nr:hypothetical protein [Longimicrobium sp.]